MEFHKGDVVGKTAKCKTCGSTTVVWQQSKAGKWYLTEVFDWQEVSRSHYRDFHSIYCNDPDAHEDKQMRISAELEEKDAANQAAHEKRKDDEAVDNTEFFLALVDLVRDDRPAAEGELKRRESRLEWFNRNPPTMDYMVEYGRELAEIKRLRVERDFLRAAMGMPPVTD